MENVDLQEVLRKHRIWLGDKEGGERADLGGAYLGDADLGDANLGGITSFLGCCGNKSEIKSIHCDLWDVTYTATHMQIGCQLHEITEWWEFSDGEISAMEHRALDWWAIWKPILKQVIETSPAKRGSENEPETQATEAAH